ncbi:MAG: hypothetical protein V7K48_29400 [Nostoc sp.]|uniref:hypothetical protein n=1 Tax=Nostoc sp. TaxID=1180 RepID=UPI002FFC8A16
MRYLFCRTLRVACFPVGVRWATPTHQQLSFSTKGDRLYKGHSKEAIALTLSLLQAAIACVKVIVNQRSH